MANKTDKLKDRLKAVRERVTQRVMETAQRVLEPAPNKPQETSVTTTKDYRDEMATLGEEPPVVARLMVEIRSDGTRTIARGALKDELSGEQVTLEAKGTSPVQLAAQLAKSLLSTPLMASQFAKAMLAARRDKNDS